MTGPSFRFPLERVRSVRERREKLAKQDLARSISRLSSSEAELRGAETELERAQAQQRELAANSGPLAGEELLARQAFLERAEAQRSRSAQELRSSEDEVAARNAQLVEASTEHEMLQKLRERLRGEHEREAARRESGVLDEIASARWHGRTA